MAKTTDIRVLFVRTTESEWDRAGRIAGSTDVPLTASGRTQLTQAFEELGEVRLTAILCGPDEASRSVARELSKATGGRVKVVEDLGEVHLGLWEGMLERDLREKCPTAYRLWVDDPAAVHVPEGESFEDAQNRLLNALYRHLGRMRTDSGSVGVVLRPVAMGLVGCAMAGVPVKGLWSMIESGPVLEWRTLERGELRIGYVPRTGVGA